MLREKQIDADKEKFAKIVDLYQACMKGASEESLEPLDEVVKEVIELFPANTERDTTSPLSCDHSETMGRTITFFETFGIPSFPQFVNEDNTEEVQLNIRPVSINDVLADNIKA